MPRDPQRWLLPRPHRARTLPALFVQTDHAGRRFGEFFTVHLRNPHTRAAYWRAVQQFGRWAAAHGVTEPRHVQPVHVAAYLEYVLQQRSKPTAKQHLAALRMLFDWLVLGQVLPVNPAAAVRGPRYTVSKGKTSVLAAEEARQLLDRVDTSTVVGLRDRALIALMTYTFARVGAAVQLRVRDYYSQGKRWWVRLPEKNGKVTEMPCHHALEAYLDAYLAAAGLAGEPHTPLFRTTRGRTGRLTAAPMTRTDVYRMLQRRAREAGLRTHISCHTFRATGITAYLKNGGRLELAQRMAGHANAKTTGLYDRRNDDLSLDEVERIAL
jgi:integrase/recombinase XerD